jgi:hypothetical protein
MVLLAEEGYVERGMPFDQAWQEMLNHSTTKVSRMSPETGRLSYQKLQVLVYKYL